MLTIHGMSQRGASVDAESGEWWGACSPGGAGNRVAYMWSRDHLAVSGLARI